MRRLFLFLLLLFVSLRLWAQSPTFQETILVTATGEPEGLLDVPSAATVVDEEELSRSLEASLSGLLRRVSGVTVLRSGLDGGVTSLFSRGSNSNHTLVLFEGIRLNDPYFGGYDWSLPLVGGVGRVEVVRGPYSALYGSDALGGVVQIFTPRLAGNRWQVFGEGGSDGWQRVQVQYGVVNTHWDLFLAAGEREGTGPEVNDSFWGKVLTLSAGWSPNPRARLGVVTRFSTSHTEVPFAGARVTPHRFTAAEETVVGLPFRVQVRSGWELFASVARVEGNLVFRDPDDPFGYVASDADKSSWQGRIVMQGRLGAHRLQLGGEWREDQVTAGSNFGLDLASRRQTIKASFAQARWRLGPAGELTTGLRYDRAGGWEELSPRAVWSRSWGRSRIWVSWGKGFRAPSLGELYYPYAGNPELQAERSQNVELGLRQRLSSRWFLQLVPFANRITNLIEFDFASFRYGNVASARQRGVELSLERRIPGELTRFSFTWLEAKDGREQELLRRPRWSGSLTWGRLFPWGQGEFSLVYVGSRADLDPVNFQRVRQGDFVTANLAGRWGVAGPLALTFRVENLADRSYEEVRGYPAPGRRFFLGLELANP